jgi:hypothetical protein
MPAGEAKMDETQATQPPSAGLVGRAKAIIMQPRAEWPRIAAETTDPKTLFMSYAVPLAAIGPIAALIGSLVFGYSFLGVTVRPSATAALSTAIVSYVLSLVSLFVVALVANFLSPKFGGRDSFPAAFRLVVYSMTAAWLAGIFGLIPQLAILGIVGLYSLYLFYLGATPVVGVPQDKALGYTVVTVLVAIVAYFVVGLLAAAITGGMGATSSFAAADPATTVDLGQFGAFSADGERGTIDLGDLGRVTIDGDTATVTVDGQEMRIEVPQEAR